MLGKPEEPKVERKTVSIRREAYRRARIAVGLLGTDLTTFVSDAIENKAEAVLRENKITVQPE